MPGSRSSVTSCRSSSAASSVRSSRVDAAERLELLRHEVRAVAAEAVQVEHQPAEVAERELAQPPQVAQPPPHPRPLAEPRRGVRGRLLDDRRTLRRRRGLRRDPLAGSAGTPAPRRKHRRPTASPTPPERSEGRRSSEPRTREGPRPSERRRRGSGFVGGSRRARRSGVVGERSPSGVGGAVGAASRAGAASAGGAASPSVGARRRIASAGAGVARRRRFGRGGGLRRGRFARRREPERVSGREGGRRRGLGVGRGRRGRGSERVAGRQRLRLVVLLGRVVRGGRLRGVLLALAQAGDAWHRIESSPGSAGHVAFPTPSRREVAADPRVSCDIRASIRHAPGRSIGLRPAHFHPEVLRCRTASSPCSTPPLLSASRRAAARPGHRRVRRAHPAARARLRRRRQVRRRQGLRHRQDDRRQAQGRDRRRRRRAEEVAADASARHGFATMGRRVAAPHHASARAARRRVRLRRRRPHRAARAARRSSRTRTSSTSATPRASRTASARVEELERFTLEIAEVLLERQGEAARRRVQHRDRRGAAGAPAADDGDDARRRRHRRRPARGGAGGRRDAHRPHRPARHAGDRPQRRLRRTRSTHVDPHVDLTSVAVPGPRADHPGRLPVRRARRRRRCAATARRSARPQRRHRDPRLHALPARPPDAPALPRPRRHASSPAARRSPGRSSTRSLARPRQPAHRRGRLPLPVHRRRRRVPRARHPLPPDAARRTSSTSRSTTEGVTAMTRSYDRTPAASCARRRSTPSFVPSATGSVLIAQGETRVICTASVEESVPRWMEGRGTGWVTAEYGMLPASTGQRKQRDVSKGRPDGRTVEIQRLIGRSLRQALDFEALGERTVWIDCDVLTADGGTRCASITGGYVALALALQDGRRRRTRSPAASPRSRCGIVDGVPLLDLDYSEDSQRRGRRERRHDRRRARSSRSRPPPSARRCSARTSTTCSRSPPAAIDELRAAQDAGDRRGVRLVLATRNAAQGARVRRRSWRRTTSTRCPTHVELPPETGDDVRRERARQGARGGRARPAEPAIADDSRHRAEALDGAPGVRSARYAGEDATDEENLAQAPARGARPAAASPTSARSPTSSRTAASTSSRAAARARWPPSRAAAAASATTRRSSRTSTRTARWPSSSPGRRTRSATAARRRARCWQWLAAALAFATWAGRLGQQRTALFSVARRGLPRRAQARSPASSPARSASSPRPRTRAPTSSPRC